MLGDMNGRIAGLVLAAVTACDDGGATRHDTRTSGSERPSSDAHRTDAARPALSGGAHDAASARAADAATDAGGQALVDGGFGGQRLCEPRTKPCRYADDLEYGGASYTEEPAYDVDYNSGDYERTLTIGTRTGPLDLTSSTGRWHTLFDAESDRPSKGTLEFATRPGWSVLQLPTPVHLHMFWRPTDCFRPGTDHPEAVAVAQNVIRDASGMLLIASGNSPLPANGTALMAPGSIPELSMRWRDVGCPVCWWAIAPPGTGRNTAVELELTLTGTGEVVRAPIGERTRIRIGSAEYVFVPLTASVPVDADAPCGSASWTLYRPDVLVEANLDGTPKEP